ncbi:crossover junction endodeoxyribonuclease RuvC [Patescibacteria group bacterium]
MRILGIDPGTATTGYGVVEEGPSGFRMITYGCITTSKDSELPARLNEIAFDLSIIISKFKPDYAAVEDIYFSKNTKTAISVAQARGVIMQKITEEQIPVTSYNPMQVKQAICSDGKAKKPQIQKMMQILLNLEDIPKPDDAADALAIAVTHGHCLKNQSLYAITA